jgi:hypothetical protein
MTAGGGHQDAAGTTAADATAATVVATTTATTMTTTTTTTDDPPGVPKERPPATSARSRGPMTQSEYLEMQSIVREVIDPNTGRVRTMRGTGEVIERIVSREEHARLNRYATSGDGSGYARDIARAAAAASHARRG